MVVNREKTYVLTDFIGSGLLLSLLLRDENGFSTLSTTAGIQGFYQYDCFGRSLST
jgi:hypothetical protein